MKRIKKVKGGLGTSWQRQDGENPHRNLMLEAMSNPDLLSSEDQCMYPERDFEAEEKRAQYLKIFKESLATLTYRQKQIVTALQNSTQEEAAKSLNITQSGIASTLTQIRKKLKKYIDNRLISEQE